MHHWPRKITPREQLRPSHTHKKKVSSEEEEGGPREDTHRARDLSKCAGHYSDVVTARWEVLARGIEVEKRGPEEERRGEESCV